VPLSGEQLNIYYNLRLNCFIGCNKEVTLEHLEEHLSICGLSACENHSICGKISKFEINNRYVCSQICADIMNLKSNNNRSPIVIFKLIKCFKLLKNKMRIELLSAEDDYLWKGFKLSK
jgi:hypothetical protein